MAPVDDGMGHLFPASSCQSPPSILYSPPLQHMSHPPPTTLPSNGGAIFAYPHDYRQVIDSPYPSHVPWSSQSSPMALPQVTAYSYPSYTSMAPAPSLAPETSLLPHGYGGSRPSRSHSASSSVGLGLSSNAPSERSPPSLSRSLSPTSPDLRAYGFPNKNGTWNCSYPGCTSRAVFTRGCDLRKHHKRHTKSFFCRHMVTQIVHSLKVEVSRVRRILHDTKRNTTLECFAIGKGVTECSAVWTIWYVT
jgi:hypothetical protein